MRAVWKFPIPLQAGDREIELPKTAKFLSFAILSCGPAAWFEVPLPPEEGLVECELDKRSFRIFGTGHSIPEGYEYRGTGLQPGREMTYVWHLYEHSPGGHINGAIEQS